MDIDRIIDDVISIEKTEPKTLPNIQKSASDQTEKTMLELLSDDLSNEDVRIEIYKRFKADSMAYFDSFASASKDTKKDNGMFACSQDTFNACCREFGIDYFKKNKYLHNFRRERSEGGIRYDDDLLCIGLEVFESLCDIYHKSFQVANCCYYLGISKQYIYRLNDLHSTYLKNAHFATENNMRMGVVSNRGNTTGYIMLMNHDYNYVRTSEVIHTSNNTEISADRLPELLPESLKIDDMSGTLNDNLL